jgi:hypothetical protein
MNVRRATINDAAWIVDLSQRVQTALTAAGNLQKIGPLPLSIVEASIQAGTTYLLEKPARRKRTQPVEKSPISCAKKARGRRIPSQSTRESRSAIEQCPSFSALWHVS